MVDELTGSGRNRQSAPNSAAVLANSATTELTLSRSFSTKGRSMYGGFHHLLHAIDSGAGGEGAFHPDY